MSDSSKSQLRKLRFAPLVRVSTEKQATKGESLRTQKKQIEAAVKSLNGTIPSWKYSGQEHATPEQERRLLDELLDDASRDIYDAVIVCDPDRWSRDNMRSKQGLAVLRKNNIRFFVLTQEYDLHNEDQTFMLALFAEVGELQAKKQNLKV